VFLSGGVFDVTRKSVWLGVFWFGADIVSPRNDSTLVLEYDIESSTFTEHSIEHIYKGAYDSITRNRVTIVAGFWYGSELRLITNLGSHLSLIDGTLTLRTDDAFGMLTRTGFVSASDKLTASTLWHYITRLPETVHTMFNNKTVSIPELDQYESTVCDFDGPTRTFLVTTRVDSCRHRFKVTNMVFLSPRLDVCSIQRETSDTIILKIDKSVSFADLGCTIVYNERPPRFLHGVDNILFSGYKWGDPIIKLYTVSAAGVVAY